MTFAFYPIQYVIDGATQHRVDNAAYQGALHDVRYVYPYLDYRVLDYALSIPRVQFLGKQNRRIFREAFKDILPESLYYLDYKDIASNRDLKRKDDYQNTFKHRLDRVLALLDHDIWNKYLNLEYISKLQAVEEEGSDEDLRMNKRYDYLQQLLLMQNAREKALKWRELDEQGLLL
jgi:asparagine synthase (glutamine-hydrolysing)